PRTGPRPNTAPHPPTPPPSPPTCTEPTTCTEYPRPPVAANGWPSPCPTPWPSAVPRAARSTTRPAWPPYCAPNETANKTDGSYPTPNRPARQRQPASDDYSSATKPARSATSPATAQRTEAYIKPGLSEASPQVRSVRWGCFA